MSKKVNQRLFRPLLNTDNIEQEVLPEVTDADDGKVLTVVDGEWDKADAQGGGEEPVIMYIPNDLTGVSTCTGYKDPERTIKYKQDEIKDARNFLVCRGKVYGTTVYYVPVSIGISSLNVEVYIIYYDGANYNYINVTRT